ncbi:hypothetical protein [Brevibacillus antibioticus]|uniref:hypothetical protein n=1 Tax=Brevibacillus antibioticus TaxID=2570228 RepID=UPI00138FDB56|nr:hypothetical protein [Brevibacillus antibioticus]
MENNDNEVREVLDALLAHSLIWRSWHSSGEITEVWTGDSYAKRDFWREQVSLRMNELPIWSISIRLLTEDECVE